MSWAVLFGLVAILGASLTAVVARRGELRLMRGTLRRRESAVRSGAAKAELQHPVVDLTRCLGCGSCVRACPEEGVLELVHGQAAVVRGARCVGAAECARECPTGAITVTLADLAERLDVPVLGEGLEAHGVPGLFLAGEVTAQALVATAVAHGTLVAGEVARRAQSLPRGAEAGERIAGQLDLVIVGAGPAGLACALEATRLGLSFVVFEQESDIGGTVARYPRNKLVLTQPLTLPLFGRLAKRTYSKEELIELWNRLAREHALPIHTGVAWTSIEPRAGGGFDVLTAEGWFAARNVCLAIGRRGMPNKLGVPGEELPNVAYGLMDAEAHRGRRALVVGGGDSAVETALGLAAQADTAVTLSYRRAELFRLKSTNAERLERAVAEGRVRLLLGTQVQSISPLEVELVDAGGRSERIPSDDVFILAGGQAPIEQLQKSGVSFDPALRPAAAVVGEQGSGLVRALAAALVLSVLVLIFAVWHADYYAAALADRPGHEKHDWLRPGRGLGLAFGIVAVALVVANLLYLVRRRAAPERRLGSLQSWMTVHVATGILAFLLALLHGAMAPGETVGGRAFWVLGLLLVTGAVGRYLYAYIPRAANGRELELAELRGRLTRLAEGFERVSPDMARLVQGEVHELVERRQWRSSLPARLLALVGAERDARRLLLRIRAEGAAAGLAADQLAEVERLTRHAHRSALVAAHLEDLRGLMAGWRWLHRWGALLLVLLVLVHVAYALLYGSHRFDGGVS